MLDLLAPALTPEQGERLTRPAYKQDFREREEAIRDACAGGREATDAVCAVGTPLPAAACGVRAADKGRPRRAGGRLRGHRPASGSGCGGGRTLFQVLYTEAGVANGAIRYTDRDLVERWENYIKALYAVGEEVISYFDREMVHLEPPTLGAGSE